MEDVREVRHFHICAGSGGGSLGFSRGSARVGNMVAKPRCIGGVDVDPAAIADFDRVGKGAKGTVMDLFSRDQYVAFHGKEPPAGWREVTPDDFRKAANYERPHVVFSSAPCKGFSGLLSEKQSATDKYQALNGLTLRSMFLALEAWGDDPFECFVMENVPRLLSRGRWLLDQITGMLRHYGYAVAETTHDCGEIGGLAQSRKRLLVVARHMAKVRPHLFEPPKSRLKGVGEVLDLIPPPGDPSVGVMHRIPALQWKTWVRLAMVEAGSDWRSLQGLRVVDGVLADFGIMPEGAMRNGVLGVRRWDDASCTVTGRGLPMNGAFSVADPRRPEGGATYGQYGVKGWDDVAATVTSQSAPGGGPYSVSDPRPGYGAGTRANVFRVVRWDDAAGVVTGAAGPSNGAGAVADPRSTTGFAGKGKYRVTGYGESAGTVIGGSTTGQGAFAVADPRHGGRPHHGVNGVTAYDAPSGTVAAASLPNNGRFAVADPRHPGNPRNGVDGVTAYDAPSGTVAGESLPGDGRFAVADPRMTWAATAHRNKLKVVRADEPAGTVTGSDRVGSGALCVADPRPEREWRAATLGVLPYGEPAGAVIGTACATTGRFSVADPRLGDAVGDAGATVGAVGLPAADERIVATIVSLDGTWHRPFTTYELAALQGYVTPGEALVMEGSSDSAWRERIGNMVPPPSATAIMSVIMKALLLSWSGSTFVLGSEPIWVRNVAVGMSLDQPAAMD